jgi:ubiquinone biosynthesis protein COQ9
MAEVPQGKRTHRISEAISALAGDKSVDVEWAEKKVR